MEKILFVTPHLSTGGQPQYLLRQIEQCLEQGARVYCVEYADITGGVFVVQRSRIAALLGEALITLGDDKSELARLISEIDPCVVHFQEVPESFVDTATLDAVYDPGRRHRIVVTTHSSHTDPASIRYGADRFVLVSEWSRRKFAAVFGEDACGVWEYPVDRPEYDKSEARSDLGLDPGYAHVLHVGLFTPGKNQKEIIELARLMLGDRVKFHFVGNQAGNFRDYWEPLMADLPANCVWHNERPDADRFYKACDAFYFPSLFELNPIAVKEAVGYGLKVFLRRLETYGDAYDGLVTYIGDDLAANAAALRRALSLGGIPGTFSFAPVYDMFVEKAADGDRIVEIGCWLGKSADYLMGGLERAGKKAFVDVIDTFKGMATPGGSGDVYQDFCDNMRGRERLSVIKDYSSEAARLYANCSIDFLAVDGDQSYDGVLADLRDFYYKVRPGGLIAGDATGFRLDGDRVRTAVCEFFVHEGAYDLLENGTGYNWCHRRPRVQVVHISTLPEQDRARKSIMNFEALRAYGIDMKFIKNDTYTGDPNLSEYLNPANIENVRPAHYGCFLAHMQAISEISDEYDYTLVLEEDAYICTGVREFVDALHRGIFACEANHSIAYVSMGADVRQWKTDYDEEFDEAWHQTAAHCYIVPTRHKAWYEEKRNSTKWDALDLWYNHIFTGGERKRLAAKKRYSWQINGVSVIDGVYKDFVKGIY